MERILFGFSAACLSGLVWPVLPSQATTLGVIGCGLLLLWFKQWPLAAFVCGFVWFQFHATQLRDWKSEVFQDATQISGKILALKTYSDASVSLDVEILSPSRRYLKPVSARLHWREPPPITVAEVWQFEVVAKEPVYSVNPGSGDAQKRAFSHYRVIKGYVTSGQRVAEANSARHDVIAQLTTQLSQFSHGDVILALMAGDRSQLTSARWRDFRHSGTGHLMAISGLHLGVAYVFTYLILKGICTSFTFIGFVLQLAKVSRLVSRYTLTVSHLGAWFCCTGYAWLAGFEIATQRAWMMLSVLALYGVIRQHISVWDRLLVALALVLLWDPMAPLSASLWLSFGALGTILISLNCWQNKPQGFAAKLLQFARMQLILCAVMSLFSLMVFDGLTLHSFWTNLLLVPLFSIVIIPVTLTALVGLLLFNQSATLVVDILNAVIHWPLALLSWCSTLPGSWLVLTRIEQAMLSGVLISAVALFFLPRSHGFLVAGALCTGPVIALLNSPSWQLHVVDVGQGLAVVVQQGPHALVYDTGASSSGFSYYRAHLAPFLAKAGISQLDYLIVSHGDNDHAGGAKPLLVDYPNTELITDEPWLLQQHRPVANCRPRQWRWRALSVELLAPKRASRDNDGSCVVRIGNSEHKVLLSGDIQLHGETRLLRYDIAADIMLAPHHGSKTSSSRAFIEAVDADVVIISSGFNNRFKLPHASVLNTYRQHDMAVFNTAYEGQIRVDFFQNFYRIQSYRRQMAPYWYNQVY
ncbi:DNA internalization-related competence protein ComEC/Rec2 [Paraferrimonas haliotis]|uniref:Recombination protein 2 n=1 Tax=Paraferrimonas haliotis TaxID=2013866 RepID=A0AA37WX32_9GAMM|nr:DNA internalization-related competence protein ComEC/Rec2 [Paraferrimonas haliotis]GLS84168.1 recombination protein 2 [Paraferrimonas haliotis]